ncbi:hypothetical protein SAY87_023241 [Trapa incisa]|uniref:ADP-ribosylation factor GTPase-activating protein AGD14 n=1 Tax=Trapa incisa TaxID=236973 RepID=A0AAN7K3Z6_9MYRT|nr:hypothetical protein SAY87_023241 [Trapa incisa]
MAKFTADEVSALQAGGNEKARQIYFRKWDPRHNSQPDGTNPYKLRDFIKHVYVDRRFMSEEGTEKIQKLRLADKENFGETQRPFSSRIGLSTLDYEDYRYSSTRSIPCRRSDDELTRYFYDDSRSPRYTKKSSRSVCYTKTPRFEIVDDRFRDDDCISRRRSSNVSMLMSKDFKSIVKRSPDNPPKPAISSEAHVERELPTKTSQKAPSSSRQSTNSSSHTNAKEDQKVTGKDNLIDGKDDANPTDVQAQQMIPSPMTIAANKGMSLASSGSSKDGEEKLQSTRPNHNTLQFLLSELSDPSALPAPIGNQVLSRTDQPTTDQNVAPGTPSRVPEPVGAPRTESQPDSSMQQPTEEALPGSSAGLVQSPMSQQYQSPLTSSHAENLSSIEQSLAEVPAISLETEPEVRPPVSPRSSQQEMGPGGRKELPADLFTFHCSEAPPAHIQGGWQHHSPQGFGFNLQYYPSHTTQLGAYTNSLKSTNPFDIEDEGTDPQGSTMQFPSLLPLQEALSNSMSPAHSVPSSFSSYPSYTQPMQPQSPQRQAFSPGHNNLPFQRCAPFSSCDILTLKWKSDAYVFGAKTCSLQQQQHGREQFGGNMNYQMMMMGYPPRTNTTGYYSSSSSSLGGGNPFS